MTDTPYLKTDTIVDALEVRDFLARSMKTAGLGSELRIESGRKLAEHLIRNDFIDVRAVEIAMAEQKRAEREHYEQVDR